MITQTSDKKSVAVSLVLIGSLFLLTGCFGKKDQENSSLNNNVTSSSGTEKGGEVLLSIDGKPVLYADEFEEQKAVIKETNQQINFLLQMMPDAEYSMLFKNIEATHVMKEWVVRQQLDQDPKFVKEMNQYIEAVKLQMYIKTYEENHKVEVSDREAEQFYKERRDSIPALITAPAGVDVVYINCKTKAQAEALAEKVKDGSEKHFKAVAKEGSIKVESMTITAESQVSPVLKNAVLGAEKFPAKEVVKIDDNSFWVVGMLKKKDAEYRSFDTPEIKEGIKKMCTDEKRTAELSKQIEKHMKEFNVVENTEYFDRKKKNISKALEKAQEIAKKAQKKDDALEDESLLDDKI
jgi:hypothetical protein